jgi:hypothetical protein
MSSEKQNYFPKKGTTLVGFCDLFIITIASDQRIVGEWAE